MAEKFIIQGGKSLKGAVEIRGAKNAALPVLAAALLTKEPCVVDNLPLIEDIFRMLDILKKLGAEISWEGKRKIKITCSGIDPKELSSCLAVGLLRTSILFLGPLLARFGRVEMPSPGGCVIGARPLDTHFDAFLQMGIKISPKGKLYYFEKDQKFKPGKNPFSFFKKGTEIVLREISVTATENVLLYSAFSPKKTLVKVADQDYGCQELCRVLKKMGAKIKGAGTHCLGISGSRNLKGFNHKIISDPIETGTFIVASLITKGEVLIKKAELSFLSLFLKRLADFGANFKVLAPNLIKVFPSTKLRIDKIQSLPYPGVHTDLQPELGVLATQTKGPTLIHDPLYEGRLKYLEDLNKMGADIVFCDPHRAIVNGPTPLYGIEIPSPDIRAGAALIIAALAAKGKTTIDNVYQIDRGYEKIEERLQELGAEIRRVKG